MNKGKFITFEGCEGAGKSRQIKLLKAYLEENNIDFIITREPGGTEISEKIRLIIQDGKNSEMTAECEALLFAAARAQHLNDTIIPNLKKGKLVVCDRYVDSSFAYQGFARGLGYDFISKINDFALNGNMPDYTLFLDIPPEKAFLRKGGADKTDRLEQSGMAFHNKVYEGYKELEKIYRGRIIAIDCFGTMFETHDKIMRCLKEKGVL